MFRVSTVGILLLAIVFATEPRLAFQVPGPVQPGYIDGVPSWRDTLEVRRGLIVVRQIVWHHLDYHLTASLQASDRFLAVRLIEAPRSDSTISYKGATMSTAYEARISGLRPGPYSLEVWRGRMGMSDTLLLRRAVAVP